MESQDAVVVSPVQESEAVLRLRPLKTNRVVEGTTPSTGYLEETWKDEPMTPAGRVFMEPILHCVCVCILGFKEPLDTEIFKQHVEMTIMKHKRFSSRVESRNGRPWWTQVKASVNDHVLETQLTPEQKVDKDFVLDYTTDVIIQKPFDRSKPLWDIHLLDAGFGEAVSCAVVRIHHALGDGTSLISLLMASTRKTGKPDLLPTLPTGSGTKQSSGNNRPSFISKLYLAICRFFVILWYSLTEIGKFVASLMWLKDTDTPIKGGAGCEHLPKKYRFTTIEVEDLKFVSKAVGGTINDSFVAMVASGLRKYMEYRIEKDSFDEGQKRNGLISNASKEGTGTSKGSWIQSYPSEYQRKRQRAWAKIPTQSFTVEARNKVSSGESVDTSEKEKINQKGLKAELDETGASKRVETAAKLAKLEKGRVRALAMINTRPAPGLPELADMMSGAASQARWGNHMGYLLLEVPLKRTEDPLELARKAMVIGNRKKSSLEGPFTYASGSLTMSLLGEKIATKLVYRSAMHTTLSISNVKGPDQEVTFAENPVTHIIPSVIGHPHALCLHLQSYNGQISLVAMATKDIIPDPEYLLQLCVEGLQEMKKAAAKALEN